MARLPRAAAGTRAWVEYVRADRAEARTARSLSFDVMALHCALRGWRTSRHRFRRRHTRGTLCRERHREWAHCPRMSPTLEGKRATPGNWRSLGGLPDDRLVELAREPNLLAFEALMRRH